MELNFKPQTSNIHLLLKDKTIAVVVPAYNEEAQIGQVIETMAEFVDRIMVGETIKIKPCLGDKNYFCNFTF